MYIRSATIRGKKSKCICYIKDALCPIHCTNTTTQMSVHAGTNVGYFPILTIRGLSLVGVHIV